MDIVLTHNLLSARGGAEKVILKIAERFSPDAIYVLRYDSERTYPEFKEFNVVEIGGKDGRGGRNLLGAVGAFRFLGLKIKDDYDVVNAHWPASHWVRYRNPRCVWYCHSPSRAVYDLYDYRRETMDAPQKLGHYFYSAGYKKIDRAVVSDIEHVFSNSKNVQGRLSKYLSRESEVLYPGVDFERYSCGEYKKYFFLPGRIDPTKRIEFAVEAFLMFHKKHPEFRLVIAGSMDPKFAWYLEKIKGMLDGVSGAYDIVLDAGAEEMSRLYSDCCAVLFSGKNEDFGMTPLEGMASSKPVIAVDEGGPRETVVGGETGFLVGSVAEMASRMEFLAVNPDSVERMGKAGRARVEREFSWKRFLDRFGHACAVVSDFED